MMNGQGYKNCFITWTLLAVNVLMLIAMYIYGGGELTRPALRFGAILPELVWGGEWWRLFASMFIHFDYMHLLMNMGGLLIIGLRAEKCFGHARYMIIYIVSGVVAALFSLFISKSFAAGASGALFGIEGAAFAYTFVTKRRLDDLSNQILLVYILIGVASGFTMQGVDNAAHVGGLLTGLALGWIFFRKNSHKKLSKRLYLLRLIHNCF